MVIKLTISTLILNLGLITTKQIGEIYIQTNKNKTKNKHTNKQCMPIAQIIVYIIIP